MMIPKKMIGSHVIRKPPMSSTEWGQVTTDCLSAPGTRRKPEGLPAARRRARAARGVTQSSIVGSSGWCSHASRRGSGTGVEPEVVEHGRPSGCKEADDRLDIVLGGAGVDEEQIERRLRRQGVSPRAGEDAHVRVIREERRARLPRAPGRPPR